MTAFDEEVVIRWRDVDVPADDRRLVIDLTHVQTRVLLKDRREHTRRVPMAMLDADDWQREVRWKRADERAQGRQAAPRRTDEHDIVAHGHLIFRKSFSRGWSRS